MRIREFDITKILSVLLISVFLLLPGCTVADDPIEGEEETAVNHVLYVWEKDELLGEFPVTSGRTINLSQYYKNMVLKVVQDTEDGCLIFSLADHGVRELLKTEKKSGCLLTENTVYAICDNMYITLADSLMDAFFDCLQKSIEQLDVSATAYIDFVQQSSGETLTYDDLSANIGISGAQYHDVTVAYNSTIIYVKFPNEVSAQQYMDMIAQPLYSAPNGYSITYKNDQCDLVSYNYAGAAIVYGPDDGTYGLGVRKGYDILLVTTCYCTSEEERILVNELNFPLISEVRIFLEYNDNAS